MLDSFCLRIVSSSVCFVCLFVLLYQILYLHQPVLAVLCGTTLERWTFLGGRLRSAE